MCVLPVMIACVCVCVFVLESSAGVGNGNNGGAQSEQGGQEVGDPSGQRTQEYHSLQESKMTKLTFCGPCSFRNTICKQAACKMHTHDVSKCLRLLFSVSGRVWEPWLAPHRARQTRYGTEDRRHQRKHTQSWGLWLTLQIIFGYKVV